VVDKAEPVQHLLVAIRRGRAGQLGMPTVPQDACEAAIANVHDEDMPVLAMLLNRAPLEAIAHALRTDQAGVSSRAQRIVRLLRPGLRIRPDDHNVGSGHGSRARLS